MMFVKDIMTSGVEYLPATATIQNAAEKMAEKDIGFLAISNGQSAVGVLTDRDIVVRGVARKKDPTQTNCQDAMTPGIATISEGATVEEAAKKMEEQRIRRLLVTDGEEKLTGILSLGDLATGCRDDSLRSHVLEEVSAG